MWFGRIYSHFSIAPSPSSFQRLRIIEKEILAPGKSRKNYEKGGGEGKDLRKESRSREGDT